MKKLTLILILLLQTIIIYSQTKKETEEWINDNINKFPVNYGIKGYNIVNEIHIENGTIYFFYGLTDRGKTGVYHWSKVLLKDIKSIEFKKNNEYINLIINFSKGKSYDSLPFENYRSKNDVYYDLNDINTDEVTRLNMEFHNSGMKERIEKALLHIIKLYGSNAIVKKEPF